MFFLIPRYYLFIALMAILLLGGASVAKAQEIISDVVATRDDDTLPLEDDDEEHIVKNQPLHGASMYGDLKYDADFTNLDYVNVDAPKQGELTIGAVGSFDSLNPFLLKGVSAAGLGLTFETLMESTSDEVFSEYGLIAETIMIPEDRSFVEFKLRDEARFHDGQPITADDVIFSFNALMEFGNPFYKAYYHNVKNVVSDNPHHVRFEFDSANNRELPLIIGQLPILPKHYWDGEARDFSKTTLDPMLGSGPYKVVDVKPGQSITYERVADWWGKDLPINQGRYNFDRIRFIYFLDDSVALQAFLSGDIDVRQENTAKTWATSYVGKAVKDGRIIMAEIPNSLPTGMQGFIYNTRRSVFSDKDVREALAYAFDFEWSNKQFAYGAYARTVSYFSNSELASFGLPEGHELEILNEYKDQVPEEVFTKEYMPPESDGTGNNRKMLRKAAQILDEAGWRLGADKIRVKDGVRLSFEIIIQNQAFERWFNPFIQNLKKIGVEATLRVLDTAQYQNRLNDFDFDMTVGTFGQSNSPGNEQRDYWSSEKANLSGSRNLMGVSSPVVDALIDRIITAPDRDELVAATRALDRVLLWNHYLIPNWYIGVWRVAHWDHLGMPEVTAPYGLGITDTWWMNGERTPESE